MKRIVILAVFTIVIFLGAFALFSAIFSTHEHEVARVKTGPVQETVYATGFVEPVIVRDLRAQRPGIIDVVFAESDEIGANPLQEGSIVAKGQAILKLRDSSREAKKSAAKSEYDRVMAQLKNGSAFRESFESRIEEANETALDLRAREVRLKTQLDAGNVSKDTYSAAKTKAIVAEERVNRLKEDLRKALADLDTTMSSAQAKYENVIAAEEDDTVRSPIDGRILQLPILSGEFAKLGQLLVRVGDTREFHIEAEVNEDDIESVQIGKPVLIRLAGAKKQVKGVVKEILPDADRTTKSFTVRIGFTKAINAAPEDLNNVPVIPGGPRLFAGMTAELGIVVRSKESALFIRRPALTRDNSVFVFKNGKVRKVKVAVGLSNFSLVEITDGLNPGDEVVITGLKLLKDGQRISTKTRGTD